MKEKDYFITKAIINKKNKQINIYPPRKKLSKEILNSINNKEKIMVKLLKWNI